MARPATMLTRRQCAALLGIAEGDVKARDGEAFHPIKGPDGSWRYAADEIAIVLRGGKSGGAAFDPSGAQCAAAFKLFQEGKALVDVVIELGQTPSVVRVLRAEFDSMVKGITLSTAAVNALERMFRTSMRTEEQLMVAVTAVEDRIRTEFHRGYEVGIADAHDLGEVVDPQTGAKRSVGAEEAATGLRLAKETWSTAVKKPEPAAP